MDSNSKPEDSGTDPLWDLPSSSMTNSDATVTRIHRKKYRSKSAVSNDPRSPYYTSPGFPKDGGLGVNGRFTKAPSVSCVPGYDGSRYADVVSKNYLPFNGGIPGLNLSPDDPKAATIRQHYYPEGGWGYVVLVCAILVEIICSGLHASFGLLLLAIMGSFGREATLMYTMIIGATSISLSLFLSPIIAALSRRKSNRLLAILGGLVCALGCLFTSFASQCHQLLFSYGVVIGSGVCLGRGTASIVVGQYFKKKRELVEIFVVSSTGIGAAAMPLLVTHAIRSMGWRLGLQAITGLVSITFILGIFYRPASLYHPQRRAILHLKGMQKRSKAKDKNAQKEKPPFFDFAVLKSRTVQILLSGSAVSAFGVNAPMLLLMYQGKREGFDHPYLLLLQAYLGVASSLGSAAYGFIVVKNSMQCLIAKQYLNQASCFMMGASVLAFTSLKEYNGYVLFAWIYGFFYGGYQYSLKTFTFEKVRARNFARAWSFVQCSQAIPSAVGLPLTGYLNQQSNGRAGFYFSAACILAGGLVLFLIDVHKKNVKRQKSNAQSYEPSVSERRENRAYYSGRRTSLQEYNIAKNLAKHRAANLAKELQRQELTCISEEVLMDNYFEDYVEDCITSCNKEEKYLMLSEFENNLLNTQESSSTSQDMRKALARDRKDSTVTPPLLDHCPNCLRVVSIDGAASCEAAVPAKTHVSRSSAKKSHEPVARQPPNKKKSYEVDVIDEVTTSL